MDFYRIKLPILLFVALFLWYLGPRESGVSVARAADSVLWMIGKADQSSAEFAGYQAGSAKEVPVPEDWRSRTDWSAIPKGLNRSQNPVMTLAYPLAQIPPNGVTFSFKILDAHKYVPQLAVYSNQMFAGMIQIAGVGGTTSAVSYNKVYELYIPKEMLQPGQNTITLEASRCLYCSANEDPYLWWVWDYMKLEALEAPAAEPIHGSYVHLGTNVKNNQAYYDQGAVNHLPYILKWLGIAYSGNYVRTVCASNVGNSCSAMSDYLDKLRQLNTGAIALHLYTGNITLNPDGSLPLEAQNILSDYLQSYGSKIQFYEVDNEPGLFNRSRDVDIAIARWLKNHRAALAPHLKIVSPGWAYDDKRGIPAGWERDPKQRKAVEDLTDFTNGHAYGTSYANNMGGSLVENIKSVGVGASGLAKPMFATEFGTKDDLTDPVVGEGASSKAAVFDRNARAHVGFADYFTQHAAFFQDYSLFKTDFSSMKTHNPAKTEIFYHDEGQDSRVKTMRRIALAYATHGKPLSYTLNNRESLKGKKVYVRAVDTSTLKPLPGSGATSNKILVNFVNFESSPQTVSARIVMPKQAVYEGERIGAGDTYEAARTYVTGLAAKPAISLSVNLGPGESVQYILEEKGSKLPEAPVILNQSVGYKSVELTWLESERAVSYNVLRSTAPEGPYDTVAARLAASSFKDTTVKNDTVYYYAIQAVGTNGAGGRPQPMEIIPSSSVALDRSGWTVTTSTGKPAGQEMLDGSPATRFDTGAPQEEGQYFIIDMQSNRTFDKVVLDTEASPHDYPRQYEMYVSTDGRNWGKAVSQGEGSVVTTMELPFPQTARYLKIAQTGRGPTFWSVHELNVYSSSLDRTGWTISGVNAGRRSLAGLHEQSNSLEFAGTQAVVADMGELQKFDRIVLDASRGQNAHPQKYSLYVSTDGAAWGNPVQSGTGGPITTITMPQQKARYIKIVNTGGSPWSVDELYVFCDSLDKDGWKSSGTGTNHPFAIDNKMFTRWDTGARQAGGESFQVDMGARKTFSRIVMDAGNSVLDYPRGYQVYVSNDGERWGAPVASGAGSVITTVRFPPQTARYVRIVQTGQAGVFWSIHEFNVYK